MHLVFAIMRKLLYPAIMEISGMYLCGTTVKYHIREK